MTFLIKKFSQKTSYFFFALTESSIYINLEKLLKYQNCIFHAISIQRSAAIFNAMIHCRNISRAISYILFHYHRAVVDQFYEIKFENEPSVQEVTTFNLYLG